MPDKSTSVVESASVEASGLIWLMSGHTAAPVATTAAAPVAMKRKSLRVGSGPVEPAATECAVTEFAATESATANPWCFFALQRARTPKAASKQERKHRQCDPTPPGRVCCGSLGRSVFWQDLNRMSIAVRAALGKHAAFQKHAPRLPAPLCLPR